MVSKMNPDQKIIKSIFNVTTYVEVQFIAELTYIVENKKQDSYINLHDSQH